MNVIRPDEQARAAWRSLSPGRSVVVVKLEPGGAEVTRYEGIVAATMTPSPWLAIQAIWTRGVVELDGLRFVPGDILHEYFSPLHPYNVFAVCSPAGELRGWYANVTYPTRLDLSSEPPTVTWHDLYLDVVALPNGQFVIRDEDELHEAGVDQRDPDLYAMIVAAGEAIVDRLRKHLFPFVDHEFSPSLPGFGER